MLAACTVLSVSAQDKRVQWHPLPITGTSKAHVASPAIKTAISGKEVSLIKDANPSVVAPPNLKSAAQTSIGCTTYDLQSNAAVSDRCLNVGGNVAALWTTSQSNDLGAADRGSGYNYMPSGGAWGSIICTRIEPVRTGWPTYARTAVGSEHVMSHISGSPLFHAYRGTTGSGTWDTTRLAPIGPPEVLWGRSVASGSDGNSVHTICISLPTGNGGTLYNGMDGCLLYYRSQDNGVTWDVVGQVPPTMDGTTYFGVSADSYAIDAKGSTVAFCHGQLDEDWAMWKSTDNGTTWTKTMIMDFPFTLYDDATMMTDVDLDGIADTILTVDHKVAILVDNNGMVHCWAGALLINDPDPASLLGLFLSTDGLLYWNESMGANPPVVIAVTPDIDGDGQLTFAADYVPRYGNGGQLSQPDAGIDASGNMYVSFVAPKENTTSGNPSPGDFSYRNVWIIGSNDGGITWGEPSLTPFAGSDFDEAVFPSMSRNVEGGCVDIIWQQDGLPGIAVQAPNGDQTLHPFGNNDIIHDCIPVASIPLSISQVNAEVIGLQIAPNPANDFVSITCEVKKMDDIKVEISDVTGKRVFVESVTPSNTGKFQFTTDISKLVDGLYMMHITVDGKTAVSKLVKN